MYAGEVESVFPEKRYSSIHSFIYAVEVESVYAVEVEVESVFPEKRADVVLFPM